MPLATAAKVEVLRVLVRAGSGARASLTPGDCDRLIETCARVAEMAPTLPTDLGADASRVARDAVDLLLAHDCPDVDRQLRTDLAHAVAGVVVRRQASA